VTPGAPDPGADDLQRLAALAMAELGESTEAEEAPPASKAESKAADQEPKAAEPVSTPVAQSPRPEPLAIPRPVASSFQASQTKPEPQPPEVAASASVAFNLNTCTKEELVKNIAGCSPDLADSIIQYRDKIGSFKRLEDLLDVPGITKAAYTNLTGEAPPDNRIPLSLNELLGFPKDLHISLKDVTERIACWPDVTGCVLSQSSGLSLVGTVPEGVDKSAVVAFAPRMFEAINKSFEEVSGKETDALVIPLSGTSFHLFRNRDLYLIIMSRLPQMPERHLKVARFVLAALSIRKE
jgi:competence ComEA-like helix-hairpin-helix protein